MNNPLQWSKYSLDIFTALRSQDPSDHHLIVGAVAGSGKTTNAVELERILATEFPHLTVGFYAFNKDIVDTLKGRLSRPESARTLHSLGLNMVANSLGFHPNLNTHKYYGLIEDSIKNMVHVDKVRETTRSILDILEKGMSELVYASSPTFEDELNEVVEHYGLDLPQMLAQQDVYNIVKDALVRGEKMARVRGQKVMRGQRPSGTPNGVCFNDMIYLPNLWDLKCPVTSSKPKQVTATDIAIGDEIQDMSKGKIQLVLRSLKPGGRFIGFGDERQAIYGFAGADASSIPNIVKLLGAKQLPLSISYRCPQAVVAEAQKIVPHIQAAPNAAQGEVRTIMDTELLKPGVLVPGSLVLSRKTNPLIKLCILLLKNHIAAKVKGRDMGKQLLTLAKDIVGANGSFDSKFESEADTYLFDQAEKMASWKDKEARLETLRDKVEAVKAIVAAYKPQNVAALSAAIDNLFSDEGSVITLSTVHRAKGLEYDNVFIIQPECLPLGWKNQKPWEAEQEANLHYVAITRAKKVLTYVTTSKKEGFEE